MSPAPPCRDGPRAPHPESTATLIARVRSGDGQARELLLARYIPILHRCAHGRLPLGLRDLLDTDDLVQVSLVRALDKIRDFEPRHEGAFLGYLRRILLNQIRDEIRRSRARPGREELQENIPDIGPSPVEELIGKETLEQYERALAKLSADHQEAVVLRVEYGFTYGEVAAALERSSGEAARQLVARALVRLAREMHAKKK